MLQLISPSIVATLVMLYARAAKQVYLSRLAQVRSVFPMEEGIYCQSTQSFVLNASGTFLSAGNACVRSNLWFKLQYGCIAGTINRIGTSV